MSTSDKFVQPSIPRFNGHYDYWSMTMENFLRSKEMWSLVDEGIPIPSIGIAPARGAKEDRGGGQAQRSEGPKLHVLGN